MNSHLWSSQRNARIQSLLLVRPFSESPMAGHCWRGRGGKIRKVLGKKKFFLKFCIFFTTSPSSSLFFGWRYYTTCRGVYISLPFLVIRQVYYPGDPLYLIYLVAGSTTVYSGPTYLWNSQGLGIYKQRVSTVYLPHLSLLQGPLEGSNLTSFIVFKDESIIQENLALFG